MLINHNWLNLPIDPTWERYSQIVSDHQNPVAFQCKFKYVKGGKREMVEKIASDYDVILSCSLAAFINAAAIKTATYLKSRIMGYYDLTRYLDHERADIKSELASIVQDVLVMPKIFSIYTSKLVITPTQIMQEKYGFTKSIEIEAMERTKEFEAYQLILNKLNLLGYINT